MREVAIVAGGMTRFGELWESSLRDMFVEAAVEALQAAGADHLDDLYIGCPLKQIAKKDEPKQHGLDQGKQHTELFPAQSLDPSIGQGQHFLNLLIHGETFPGQ